MAPAATGNSSSSASTRAVKPRVMVVDDTATQRQSLVEVLRRSGYQAIEASDGNQALDRFQTENPDAVLLDVRLPGLDGMQVLREIRRADEEVPVIMMTGFADVRTAVHSMRLGAQDYLTKPLNYDELSIVLKKVLKVRDLSREVQRLRSRLGPVESLLEQMGSGPAVRLIGEQIERVAATDFTVVIVGESGAGKELVARAVHAQSRRAQAPFVALDCGAISETLAESELFVHERGAFTGAERRHPGCFEQAGAGTLFLDEIGNLSPSVQVRLLRALQERQVRRLGGESPVPLEARIIASTLRPLADLVREGNFREDLFYRLNEFTIEVPPLRLRPEDLLYLAQRFLKTTCIELERPLPGFTPEALDRLAQHDWPGNVRELRNVMRRAALLAKGQVLPENLNIPPAGRSPAAGEGPQSSRPHDLLDGVVLDGSRPMAEVLEEVRQCAERKLIRQALARTGGNKAAAARLLHINYKTLYVKMKRYGRAGGREQASNR